MDRAGRGCAHREIPVAAGAPAGSTVTIWTDASGRLAPSPGARRAIPAALAAVLAAAGAGLALWCAQWLARRALDR